MAKYQHLRSSAPGRVPSAADLEVGQIAINFSDGALYTKNEAGQVVRIGVATYTRAEMDQRFVPQGILPVTRVGDLSEAALPATLSGTNIVVSQDIPVLLSGRVYKIAAGSYSFANDVAGNSSTRPLYIYISLSNGMAEFMYSFSVFSETATRVYIGWVNMSSQTASNLTLSKVSRLDIYRPSTVEAGSAFPVTSGPAASDGSIDW